MFLDRVSKGPQQRRRPHGRDLRHVQLLKNKHAQLQLSKMVWYE